MTFAAALSEHPIPVEATGEVIGAVLEAVGPEPAIAVLFVSGAHAGAFEDMARAVRDVLRPAALVGSTAVSVLAGAREVEERPAVALWAASSCAGRSMAVGAVPTPEDTWELTGVQPDELAHTSTMLLLADPASFPVAEVLDVLARDHPHLRVIGGLASAGVAPGANRLTVDGRTLGGGAAAILLGPDTVVDTVVSQGCHPVGRPLTVTRAERNVVYEIAGRPALEQLQTVLEGLEPIELSMARAGVHLGRVIDEHKAEFGRGDFLVRNVMGADRTVGALAVGDQVDVGDTVQFQVRDADSADEDLRALLADREAAAALVFTCNGRGMRLFGRPDHDAEVVSSVVGNASVAGMFCAGEVGPVGGRSFLHGFTASVALFRAPPGEGSIG